jgi:hypothetical protein
MINVIEQPAPWTSAYDEAIYRFTNTQLFSLLAVSASTTKPQYMAVNVYSQFDIFKIGYKVYFPNLLPSGPYEIIGTEGSKIIITMAAGMFGFSEDILLHKEEPVVCKLLVGYLPTHNLYSFRPISEYATIQAIFKGGEYKINVAGFMQDAFYNLMAADATGVDQNLHLHYELYVSEFNGSGQLNLNGSPVYNSGLDYKIGNTKFCLNGCVEDVNASGFVALYGTPLQSPIDSGVIKQNEQTSIYSYIIDDQVITTTI